MKRKEAQWKKVHAYMKTGLSITHFQAEAKFNCTRLAARIADIEGYTGIRPERELITSRSGAEFMKYWLSVEDRLV